MDFSVDVDTRSGGSGEDLTGVYSWGERRDGSIDFPRDNRTFFGTKSEMEAQPYVQMIHASVGEHYNARLSL